MVSQPVRIPTSRCLADADNVADNGWPGLFDLFVDHEFANQLKLIVVISVV